MNDEKISIKQELKNGASDKPIRLIAYSDSNAKIKSSVQLWMQSFIELVEIDPTFGEPDHILQVRCP